MRLDHFKKKSRMEIAPFLNELQTNRHVKLYFFRRESKSKERQGTNCYEPVQNRELPPHTDFIKYYSKWKKVFQLTEAGLRELNPGKGRPTAPGNISFGAI